MRVPLSRYSMAEVIVFGIMLSGASILAWLYVGVWLSVIFLGLLVFLLAFFRDPTRKVPQEPGLVVSPADGKIVEITQTDDCPLLPGKVLKIGIFMSVFNVHVNRAPAVGKVTMLEHVPGKFYNALRSKAGAVNESNNVLLNCPDVPGKRVLVKQIAGVLARRIVCGCKLAEQLARGQRFGMIKFGSRVEVYLKYSQELRVQVRQGEKVKAGSSVLLRYGKK
ncbi:MAG: phosphatidylserine decarboxylase family protein [Actinobacteria bacterium]|nr:phosphatidylserine decarboxylase family protein [Actinomycetota bacterium]